MKKIISFSLWGNNPIYTIGAIRNAELAQEIYPDWTCRFYIGKSTKIPIIRSLMEKNNTELYIMNEEGNWNGMFWRFLAADDPSVDIMISRDTDSRLSFREKQAVDEWLTTDKVVHIMRDHPYHKIEMPGGMWGFQKTRYKSFLPIRSNLNNYKKENCWQTDQRFLTTNIYPILWRTAETFEHDEFFTEFGPTNPFPTPRENREFVGQQFDESDKPLHPEHMELLN